MTQPRSMALSDRISAAIKSNPRLYRILLPCVNLVRRATSGAPTREIRRFRKHCLSLSKIVARPVFVKVGANDGVSGDPCSDILLSQATWKGLLIEPVPYCFERLKENFGDSQRFSLEQVAIGKTRGRATFYYVDSQAAGSVPGLPSYFNQLGSFDRSHILKHLGGSLEPFIVEREVEVCTLAEVLERNAIRDVHLLHVDVEGHDFEVLKTIDLADRGPLMIFIEHKHLSPSDRAQMVELLRTNGYSVRDCGDDYFALHEAAHRRLERGQPLHH
jgi:FkbM family methyltransferase